MQILSKLQIWCCMGESKEAKCTLTDVESALLLTSLVRRHDCPLVVSIGNSKRSEVLCGSPVVCLGLAVLERLVWLVDRAIPPALTAHKLHLHVQAPPSGRANTSSSRQGADVPVSGSCKLGWNVCRLQPITSQMGKTDQGRANNEEYNT